MSLLVFLGGQPGLPVTLAAPRMKACWLTATGTFSFLLGHQNPYLPNTKKLYQLHEAVLVVVLNYPIDLWPLGSYLIYIGVYSLLLSLCLAV